MKLRTFFLVGLVVLVYLLLAFFAAFAVLFSQNMDDLAMSYYSLQGQWMAYFFIAGVICGFVGAVWSITLAIHALASHQSHSHLPQFKQGLERPLFVIKLILVPYVLVALSAILSLVLSGTLLAVVSPLASIWGIGMLALSLVAWVVAIVLAIGSYLFLVATAGYAVSRIVIARRESQISTGLCVRYCILAFVPVADIISYPMFLRRLKRLSS